MGVDATTGFTFAIHDAAGSLLAQGTSNGTYLTADFRDKAAYRADLGFKNGTQLMLAFDTSRADANPPVLTSLRIVDADQHLVRRAALHAPATLAFSVADYARDPNGLPRDLDDLRVVRASWRAAGGAWQELPLAIALQDRGDPLVLGHNETGTHYRADLTPAAAVPGTIDLRIELEDADGNASTSILADAFSIADRRRMVRR